ncbi:hypothetical protein DMUE_4040 [Dictyocoela muelleri]|nr:hypothetical protein DMUE_4040 [Dictyocoela muelleri]
MSDKDEEIIHLLDSINRTFSQINMELRDISEVQKEIISCNKKIVSDCRPWINFFIVPEKKNNANDSITTEITEDELIEFDKNMLPDVFADEADLVKVYEFFRNGGKLDEAYKFFESIGKDRLEVYTEILIRKKFINARNL